MRLLWVVNIPPLEAGELWGLEPTVGGGWLEGAMAGVQALDVAELHVAFPRGQGGETRIGHNAEFHTIVEERRRSKITGRPPGTTEGLEVLMRRTRPEVIHLWGTESRHAWPTVRAARRAGVPVVVSIQGLLGPISRHYRAGLPASLQTRRHWSDLLLPRSPRAMAGSLQRASMGESACLTHADLIIGRTSWDRAASLAAGATATYYHCDEILRPQFYEHQWRVSVAEPFRVFVPQGHVPYKGLHVALEAMSQLKSRYPKAHLAVAGQDPRPLPGPYARYLGKLIARGGLESSVTFLGAQNADDMVRQMLLANAFVLPSLIENSPNSLGEAMLLGVPCVASYVGGVPDMLKHEVDGLLYQADAPYMLAYQLARVFDQSDYAEGLGRAASTRARARHDRTRNTELLVGAYKAVL